MKSVMLSIKPHWCELIASGKKTVEVRKTRPKIETPFKCYIYCTKSRYVFNEYDKFINMENKIMGKVIGEFVCDRIREYYSRGINDNFDYCYLSLNEWGNDDIEYEIRDIQKSCISKTELNEYSKGHYKIFCWHISDLKIYDKPMELGEFSRVNVKCKYKNGYIFAMPEKELFKLKRPPQNWYYVEELK